MIGEAQVIGMKADLEIRLLDLARLLGQRRCRPERKHLADRRQDRGGTDRPEAGRVAVPHSGTAARNTDAATASSTLAGARPQPQPARMPAEVVDRRADEAAHYSAAAAHRIGCLDRRPRRARLDRQARIARPFVERSEVEPHVFDPGLLQRDERVGRPRPLEAEQIDRRAFVDPDAMALGHDLFRRP